MAALLSVDNDRAVNSVAALASVEAKEGVSPSASPIVQAVKEDDSLADDRFAPSGALNVSEAML
jgi:hypothetical protein